MYTSSIRLQHGNQVYMLLCVYMPYECRDNEGSYLENLGTLKTIIDELDCTCIYQGRRSGYESGGGDGIHVNPERSFGGTSGEPPSEASQLRKGGPGVLPRKI